MRKKRESHDDDSWVPADWDLADASAMQALERGEASPEQQKRALNWIIVKACRYYEPEYKPGGAEGERDSCHASGRRWAGIQIVKLLKLNVAQLRKTNA